MAKRTAKKKKPVKARRRKTLIDRMELKAVRLISVAANVHVEGKQAPVDKTEIRVEAGWGIIEDEGIALGNVTLLVEGNPPQGGSKMSLMVTYQAIFELQAIPDLTKVPESEKDSIKDLSVHILWPYLRDFTQSLTARMGLPPLGLPLMRVGAVPSNLQPTSIRKSVRKKR